MGTTTGASSSISDSDSDSETPSSTLAVSTTPSLDTGGWDISSTAPIPTEMETTSVTIENGQLEDQSAPAAEVEDQSVAVVQDDELSDRSIKKAKKQKKKDKKKEKKLEKELRKKLKKEKKKEKKT